MSCTWAIYHLLQQETTRGYLPWRVFCWYLLQRFFQSSLVRIIYCLYIVYTLIANYFYTMLQSQGPPYLLSWRCYILHNCLYLHHKLLTGNLFVRIQHSYQRGLDVSRTTLQETLYLLSLPPPVLFIMDSALSTIKRNYQELPTLKSILVKFSGRSRLYMYIYLLLV